MPMYKVRQNKEQKLAHHQIKTTNEYERQKRELSDQPKFMEKNDDNLEQFEDKMSKYATLWNDHFSWILVTKQWPQFSEKTAPIY